MTPIIPQQDPIRMVDDVVPIDDEHATTSFTMKGNQYLQAEAAIIEHAAQSCAALVGYRSETADLGYIGEVKKFHIYRLPNVGETLNTFLSIEAEFSGIILVNSTTKIGEDTIAEGQLKLFINE